MPLCAKCGQKLVCNCGTPTGVDSTSKPCPLQKGAIWVHVRDDLGGDLPGVEAISKGGKKPSDKSGLSTFDPLDPGDYDVDLSPLSTELLKLYDLPKAPTKMKATVAPGEITYVPYTVPRKALLQVKVVLDDGTKTFDGAKVAISGGPTTVPEKTTASGIADCGRVSAGKYTVKVTLGEEDAKDYATTIDFATAGHEVELAAGEESEVKIEVEKKNIVKPKLELEYKLILLDGKLYDKQSGEAKIQPSPTYVEVSLEQSNPKHPFKKTGTLEGIAGKAEAYLEEHCKTKIADAKLTDVQLTGDKPFKVYLRGTGAGKFKIKLKLEDPADRFIRLDKNPTDEQEMGVVKLEMKLHQQDLTKLKASTMQVDPDTDPVEDYYTALKDKVIPDQKEMTPEEKIGKGSKDDAANPGRLLHTQSSGHFGRAKLICAKLDGANVPDGCDDYEIVLNTGRGWAPESGTGSMKPEELMGGDKDTPASGALAIFAGEDPAVETTAKDPVKIKVSALKAAEKVFWVEGKTETNEVCDIRLDIGMDRAEGGLAKTVKRNGDWARFTVVTIKETKVKYTPVTGEAEAWDSGTNRFYINFKTGDDGRKITIEAELTKALKNVNLYFMLAPDKDNRKAANWELDMPTTWVWKDVDEDVKHKDKTDRKDFLHYTEKTGADGKAKKEMLLSRFGGDKFTPGVYMEQDSHLAKYVHGHTDLEKRKPVLATAAVTVWRKFWYQIIEVSGVANPGVAGAVGQYLRIKSTMEAATAATKTLPQARGWNAIYPMYMTRLNGGNADSVVVSNLNKTDFFGGTDPETDKPIKVPILICDAQWDEGPATSPVTTGYLAAGTYNVTMDRLVLKPPLQGGDLRVAGRVQYRHPGSTPGSWVNRPPVDLTDADLDIDPGRGSLYAVRVKMPATVQSHAASNPGTEIKIIGLRVAGAKGPYLGESFDKKVLAVYDPSEPADFQNTIAHEIGHGFSQTVEHGDQPTGIPDHPNQYLSYDSDGDCTGSHCNKDTNKCVMYQSGPIAGSHNKYCDVCHPYMLVHDMSTYS